MHHELVAEVRPRLGTLSKILALLGAFLLLAVAGTISSVPAHATTDLANVSLSVSNNATSSTGADNTATYTWLFTTATAATLTEIDLTVPTGTTGTPSTTVLYGLPGCSGSSALSGTTVTVTLTGCGSILAGTPVSIAVSGFTNTTTATTAFKTSVTTKASGVVDGPTSAATGLDFDQNSTVVTVVVPDSLTFTNENTALTLLPVPGSSAPATGKVNLTVATNAASGYSLSACVPAADVIKKDGSTTIGQLASAGPLDGTASAFGAQASVASNAGSSPAGTGTATVKNDWAATGGSNYIGYASACDTSTTDSVVVNNNGSTNGDAVTFTNGVSADAVQSAGTYTGTIRYQLTPSY